MPWSKRQRQIGPISRRMPKATKMAIELPYGLWTCADGREVLYNRRYRPIWQRRLDKKPMPADPDERVPFVSQKWFWRCTPDAPWRSKTTLTQCGAVLTAWKLPTDLFELSRMRSPVLGVGNPAITEPMHGF